MAAGIYDRRVIDANSGPYEGAVPMTVGTPVAVARAIGVACTVAGNVAATLSDGSIVIVPVAVGWSVFPFAATAINTTGTTATATYYNLK